MCHVQTSCGGGGGGWGGVERIPICKRWEFPMLIASLRSVNHGFWCQGVKGV